jgi:hypothetical protein
MNGKVNDIGVFNLTEVPSCQIPTMALKLGEHEWLAELSSRSLNIASILGYDETKQVLSLPSFVHDQLVTLYTACW